MLSQEENRVYQRLPLKLNLLCQSVGLRSGQIHSGSTLNVSSGGLLAKLNGRKMNEGSLLNVEMTVPPTEGLLEYGGRFSSYARVIRVERMIPQEVCHPEKPIQTVAMEFCEPLKLHV